MFHEFALGLYDKQLYIVKSALRMLIPAHALPDEEWQLQCKKLEGCRRKVAEQSSCTERLNSLSVVGCFAKLVGHCQISGRAAQ